MGLNEKTTGLAHGKPSEELTALQVPASPHLSISTLRPDGISNVQNYLMKLPWVLFLPSPSGHQDSVGSGEELAGLALRGMVRRRRE